MKGWQQVNGSEPRQRPCWKKRTKQWEVKKKQKQNKKKQQQENIKDNKTKEKGRKHWKDASYKKPRI